MRKVGVFAAATNSILQKLNGCSATGDLRVKKALERLSIEGSSLLISCLKEERENHCVGLTSSISFLPFCDKNIQLNECPRIFIMKNYLNLEGRNPGSTLSLIKYGNSIEG